MARFIFNTFCGCIGLRKGTKTFGIILVILKILRLMDVLFFAVVSYAVRFFSNGLTFQHEVKFAMPYVSAVAIVLQLVFLIRFIIKLFKNHIDDYGREFIVNLVLFGIECAAVAIFWIVAFPFGRLKIEIVFIAGDVLVIVSNIYFILLMRSCIAKNYETQPHSTYNKDRDKLAVPFIII